MPLRYESFNQADNASSLGPHWTNWRGTFGTQGNQGYLATGALTQVNLAMIDLGKGDGVIRMDVPTWFSSNGGFGIMFRAADVNNHYIADFGSGAAALFKGVGGSYTSLGSMSGGLLASGDQIYVSFIGSQIICKRLRNGVWSTLLTVTDTTYGSQFTKAGVYVYATDSTSRFDNYIFDDLSYQNRYLAEVLADAPVALWHLDEPASPFIDAIGEIAIPVSGAGSVSYRQAPILPAADRKCAFFPSSCQSVRNSSAAPTGFPRTANWSLECWFKPTTLASAGGVSSTLLYVGDSASDGMGIYVGNASGGTASPTTLQALFGGVAVVPRNFTCTQNAPHHVVITRDSSTMLMYVNGAPVGVGYTTSAPLSPSSKIAIGDESANTSGPVAYLQFPAIYSSVLSPDRILAHYNAGLIGDGVVM